MQHFQDENWIDLVRGVAPYELQTAIKDHLKSGCITCARDFAVWGQVSDHARSDTFFAPPTALVSTVKLMLPANASATGGSRARQIAELIFDSFCTPQVVGVRGTPMVARQLRYKAGPILIDMRLESLEDSGRCSLVGQVVQTEEDRQGLPDLNVHLLRGQNELANTHTNSFGEFRLEYETARDLQVALEVSPLKEVYIPLEGKLWRPPPTS